MEHAFSITVPFVIGKARPRFVRKTGRVYTDSTTRRAMQAIRDEWEASAGEMAPEHVPVDVTIVTLRALPESRPRDVRREHDTFKPDIDNVQKLVFDALNGVAWADDAQVTSVYALKLKRIRGVQDQTTINVRWSTDD